MLSAAPSAIDLVAVRRSTSFIPNEDQTTWTSRGSCLLLCCSLSYHCISHHMRSGWLILELDHAPGRRALLVSTMAMSDFSIVHDVILASVSPQNLIVFLFSPVRRRCPISPNLVRMMSRRSCRVFCRCRC